MPASKTKPTPLKRNTVALPIVNGHWHTDTGVAMLEWHCPYCWHREQLTILAIRPVHQVMLHGCTTKLYHYLVTLTDPTPYNLR